MFELNISRRSRRAQESQFCVKWKEGWYHFEPRTKIKFPWERCFLISEAYNGLHLLYQWVIKKNCGNHFNKIRFYILNGIQIQVQMTYSFLLSFSCSFSFSFPFSPFFVHIFYFIYLRYGRLAGLVDRSTSVQAAFCENLLWCKSLNFVLK